MERKERSRSENKKNNKRLASMQYDYNASYLATV